MLDSIHVGVTGLLGYQQGLRTIANNTANLNTPGYKSSSLQFTDLFYSSSSSGGRSLQVGYGLDTAGTRLDFSQGDLRQTGNDFDLAVDGEGLFVLKDLNGETRYTRAGQFGFDKDGVLVSRIDGSKVMGLDSAGRSVEITLDNMRVGPAKATTVIRLTGNLSSTSTEQTVNALKVFDALGRENALSVKFTNTNATSAGSWKVEVFDGATLVGTSQVVFVDGEATPATSKFTFSYTPAGGVAQPLTLDMSADVTSFASGSLSTLAMTSQDGHAPGSLTKVTFDATGTLVATYSNGQTVKGSRLALGRFDSLDAVEPLGGGEFREAGGIPWTVGGAGEGGFGTLRAGMLEISNVDLSREFSSLVVMQRGYQASSQVISTANDMLQELFGMKHK